MSHLFERVERNDRAWSKNGVCVVKNEPFDGTAMRVLVYSIKHTTKTETKERYFVVWERVCKSRMTFFIKFK